MKVMIIGLGSMGRRRIRLIKRYNKSYEIIGIDLDDARRKFCEGKFQIETHSKLEEVLHSNTINCAFICTSPLSHSQLINVCLENNVNVFTELNLVSDGYEENILLAKEKDKTLFLSSTFLHREEIKKIDEIVKKQIKRLNYTYHVGQYLPDWHPWESYKDFFVGDKRTNGCREIFAIELPWIVEVFGEIDEIIIRKSKMSSLDVDYNDNYLLIIEHKSGHKGMLAVDVVSRKPVRNLEIFGEEIYLSWDGSPKGLKKINLDNQKEESIKLYEKADQLKEYSEFVVENAYYNEIKSFFESIEKGTMPVYSFEKDKKILKLIDGIEA